MGSATALDILRSHPHLLIAAFMAGGLAVVQVLGGIATGSLVLLAAAGLMLPRATTLALSWWEAVSRGFQLHPPRYAFDRVKVLTIYTVSVAGFAVGIWIAAEAVGRLTDPVPVRAWPMLGISLFGLLVAAGMLLLVHGTGHATRNAGGFVRHVAGELFGSTVATFAAVSMLASNVPLIDPVLAVPVAVLILLGASVMLGETSHRLLQGATAETDRETIARDIKANVRGVLDVRHLHVWSHDGVSTKATLQAWLSEGADAHAAICDIKLRLAKHHRIEHVTVEPEFGHNAGRPAGTHLH